MKEEFLQYLWATKQVCSSDLITTSGQSIKIINTGEQNFHSGPDFFNANLKINDILWTGNVEIHIKTSDWLKHKHQNDTAYNNVILHVVFENDMDLKMNNGQPMATLVLKNSVDQILYENYLRLVKSPAKIACAIQVKEIPAIKMISWLSKVVVERLERKVGELKIELEQNSNDWEELFYRHLAKQFGMKINADPFQWLAAALPFTTVSRQKDSLLQLESILFGQSGLLPEIEEDDYTATLIREYLFLQTKFQLRPLPTHSWKFMRLRPNNFPTIRIAQLAGLLFRQPKLFRLCMETTNLAELNNIFEVSASDYWNNHYRFGKISKNYPKNLGKQAINVILINTVVPFKFLYGKVNGDDTLVQDSISLLEKIESEDNKIIRAWKSAGILPGAALESQALLELQKIYCDKKQCLRCELGNYLLGRN